MKIILLFLSSLIVLFAATPQEREANLQNVVDMQISNTAVLEKRITKIHTELERKAQERLEKEKLREDKRKKLDEALQAKATARAQASK